MRETHAAPLSTAMSLWELIRAKTVHYSETPRETTQNETKSGLKWGVLSRGKYQTITIQQSSEKEVFRRAGEGCISRGGLSRGVLLYSKSAYVELLKEITDMLSMSDFCRSVDDKGVRYHDEWRQDIGDKADGWDACIMVINWGSMRQALITAVSPPHQTS